MASIVNRYGNKNVSYMLIKSVPRIVAVTVIGAVGAEWVGSGFMDSVWNSLNSGVRIFNEERGQFE
jgi:predicted small integral membrane protein